MELICYPHKHKWRESATIKNIMLIHLDLHPTIIEYCQEHNLETSSCSANDTPESAAECGIFALLLREKANAQKVDTHTTSQKERSQLTDKEKVILQGHDELDKAYYDKH